MGWFLTGCIPALPMKHPVASMRFLKNPAQDDEDIYLIENQQKFSVITDYYKN
jgi:hypothetical protein